MPLGTFWVTQQQTKTNFETAINTAKAALTSTSQAAVNSAVATLTNQIEQFKNARQTGIADPVNKTAIEARIAEAEQAKLGVATSANGSDVAQGIKWVSPTTMFNFEIAITTAKAAVSAATTQTAVDNLLAALNTAISTFTNAQQNGSKTSGFTQAELTALIASANAAKTGVETNTNGDSVSPVKYWVSQEVLSTFNNVISTAQAATGNIDGAYSVLVSAINTFNSAKKLGSMPNKVDLFNAIRSADTVKDGVVVAASAAQAPSGSKWATQAQWTPFDTAYNNALILAGDSNATKNQVSALTNALTSATNTFSLAVNANGLGTKQNSITINGLSSFSNWTEISLVLYADTVNIINEQPEIYGSGYILNGTVTVNLSWSGNGSWYVGFIVPTDTDTLQFYISKSAVNFTVTPNPVTNFSDYKKYVFKYTIGEIADEIEYTIPSNGITLDELCQEMMGMTYAEIRQAGYYIFYKDEALTQPFHGSDKLYAATVIYSELPLYFLNGGEEETEYTDVVYSEDGSSITLYIDGVGVPDNLARSSMSTGLAIMADFFEVIFVSGTNIARASWELGDLAGISGIVRGVDYNSTSDACMFIGRRNEKTLLGVGKMTGTDTGGTTITDNTKSVTFVISAIQTGLLAGNETVASNPVGAVADSFTYVPGGAAGYTSRNDTNSYRVTLGGVQYPVYSLPVDNNGNGSIVNATYTFSFYGTMSDYLPAIKHVGTTNLPRVQKRSPRYYEGGGYFLQPKDHVDTKTRVELDSSYTSVNAGTPFNPVIPLTFTIMPASGGLFSFNLQIPVFMLSDAPATNGGPDAITWRISTGFGSDFYNLDSGKNSGGCVFMGVGVTQFNFLGIEWVLLQ